MVCSMGSGRMATMARLLVDGSISQPITEDVRHQKLAAQSIYSELWEADEANLLDEDDMHVFGLKPMTDPLDLVCCNACKKPVKVSQFAAHAELCKSLSSAEEIVLKLNRGSNHKKPPRKERKKSSNVYAEPILDEQMQLTSSSPVEAKDELLMMGGSGINPGRADNLAGSLAPRTKRSKLISADSLLKSDHLETASGVTKSFFINTQEAFTCGDLNGLKTGSRTTSDHVVGYQMPRQVGDCYMLTKEVPAPLATKIYYSQRDHRLRSAINNLFKKLDGPYHGSSHSSLEGGYYNQKLVILICGKSYNCGNPKWFFYPIAHIFSLFQLNSGSGHRGYFLALYNTKQVLGGN